MTVAINRRDLVLGGGTAALASVSGFRRAAAQSVPDNPGEPTSVERGAMAGAAKEFMRAHSVPGLGLAVAYRGHILYDTAFGVADRETDERLTVLHRFRVASVSKPITSVAIFALIEGGSLNLDNRVFGRNGILVRLSGAPEGTGLDQITIEHLLTHTSGGWPNDMNDPMFRDRLLDHHALIQKVVRTDSLRSAPGTMYAYSNFGYCLLGRVIETITGKSYQQHVQNGILRRVGINDMEIAGNTLADRRPGEVRYYGQNDENPYGMNVQRMDSHGGWIARPASLAIFASHLDVSDGSSMLHAAAIKEMTRASNANPYYAKGWQINRANNWWHTGSLPGTTSIIVRTHSGFSWAALLNTRRPGSRIAADLDRLVWTMVRKVAGWAA